MFNASHRPIRVVLALVACSAVAIAGTSCNATSSSPTAPTQTVAPPPPPPPPPPAAPVVNGALRVEVKPNPVPFSGQPITDAASCASSPNTWFYEQVITETGGAAVTLIERVDLFDGRQTSKSNISMDVAAKGTMTIRSRWCSVSNAAHTAQTNFTARDASGRTFSQDGPVVNLLKK
jgi:hypothetical protein